MSRPQLAARCLRPACRVVRTRVRAGVTTLILAHRQARAFTLPPSLGLDWSSSKAVPSGCQPPSLQARPGPGGCQSRWAVTVLTRPGSVSGTRRLGAVTVLLSRDRCTMRPLWGRLAGPRIPGHAVPVPPAVTVKNSRLGLDRDSA
jgi:hypothetical protein